MPRAAPTREKKKQARAEKKRKEKIRSKQEGEAAPLPENEKKEEEKKKKKKKRRKEKRKLPEEEARKEGNDIDDLFASFGSAKVGRPPRARTRPAPRRRHPERGRGPLQAPGAVRPPLAAVQGYPRAGRFSSLRGCRPRPSGAVPLSGRTPPGSIVRPRASPHPRESPLAVTFSHPTTNHPQAVLAAAPPPPPPAKRARPSPAAAPPPKDDMGLTRAGASSSRRRTTDDGLPLYDVSDLGLGRGGDTSECPFDCQCCF